MKILSSLGRWLCRFGMSIALSLWITLATMQATVLDRTTVKSWLAESGLYATGLKVSNKNAEKTSTLVTNKVLQQAFSKTFDADYLKKNANTIIDASYDWLDGKKQTIAFSIPVQEKAEAFAANVATIIEPKLAALPVCASRLSTTDELTCLPAGVSAADFAAQITKPSNSSPFTMPLTQETFGAQGLPQLGWLPQTVQGARVAVFTLPLLIIGLGGLFVLLSPDKIRGASRVGRHVTISAGVTLVGGIFLWIIGGSVNVAGLIDGVDPEQVAAVAAIANPLIHTILPDVGQALTLYSGIAVVLGGALWIAMFILHHKRPLEHSKHPTA